MGRVTIFSIDECPHCQRTKAAFDKRKIPFTEINISLYPQKRADMISLSDQLTVPQVFFNAKHIGGADNTIALLKNWDEDLEFPPFEKFEYSIECMPDPTDPRLQLPAQPPRTLSIMALPRPQKNCIHLPSGAAVSVLEIMETLKMILPRQDLKFNLHTYKNCFKASDGVTAISEYFSITREKAVQFVQGELQPRSILTHVVDSTHKFADTMSLFFRLQCYQTPRILNSYRIWTERVDPDCIALLKRLKTRLFKIEKDNLDPITGCINYLEAESHTSFAEFEEHICELQGVKLENMDEHTKLAFCINLYNIMIQYAFIKVGIATTDLSRLSFFNNVKFNVGGVVFSFQDFENGILRANRKAPFGLTVPFNSKDERLSLIVQKVDPRIHFALNCGARSCPPIKNFTSNAIQEELRIVAMAFCQDNNNVYIDDATRTLHLSTIFKWYKEDFATKSSELPEAILPYLRGPKQKRLKRLLMVDIPEGSSNGGDDRNGNNNKGDKITIKYLPYDWSPNATEFKLFDGSVLKANPNRLLA